MNTAFSVVSGQTVPLNYSWDKGVPFGGKAGTSTYVTSFTNVITGYAPGLKVIFSNNSSYDAGSDTTYQDSYSWNFGDYYNIRSNSLTINCPMNVEHTYIMPGIYVVNLNHTRTQTLQVIDPTLTYCQGIYGFQWYWDNLKKGFATALTWDQLGCNTTLPAGQQRYIKHWASETGCFDRYCSLWDWYDLQSVSNGGGNPYTWEDTSGTGKYPKKWYGQEGQVKAATCTTDTDAKVNTVINTDHGTAVSNVIIQVFELPPKAGLVCINNNNIYNTVSGTSPFNVHLSPRSCIPGSFPIDRIDWDFGDGTGVVTVERYTPPNSTIFTNNNIFSDDPLDPRNFDALHAYVHNINNANVFYPSITAYASSTGTTDSVSVKIGPVLFRSTGSADIKLLKARNTPNGVLYAFEVDGGIAFNRFKSDATTNATHTNTPSNPLKDTTALAMPIYRGNNGVGYPPAYSPNCVYIPPAPPPDIAERYLVEEYTGVQPLTAVLAEDFGGQYEGDLIFVP
jgi:hypothetical protein